MDPQSRETHHDEGFWARVRPTTTIGWAYWGIGLLLIVLIIGGACLYLPAMFADVEPTASRGLLQVAALLG